MAERRGRRFRCAVVCILLSGAARQINAAAGIILGLSARPGRAAFDAGGAAAGGLHAGAGGGGDAGAAAAALQRMLAAAKAHRLRHAGTLLLTPRQVHRALYMGDSERIRAFVARMASGAPVTVALLGGSVSVGMGAVAGEPSFGRWLEGWAGEVLPLTAEAAAAAAGLAAAEVAAEAEAEAGDDGRANTAGAAVVAHGGGGGGGAWVASSVRFVNAACAATSSAYMNMCLAEYLRHPGSVDAVLLEYAINDAAWPLPAMENEQRKSFELLVRKLLSLPRAPPVVLLNGYRWWTEQHLADVNRSSNGLYYWNAEAQFFEVATFYGLQMLSVKAATYHQMRAGVRGYRVDTVRYRTRNNASADPGALFYEDPVHPSGLTGHRVIAELVIGLLLHVARGLLATPWRESESAALSAPLPPHLIPGNADSALDVCLMGHKLRAAALEAQGFAWLNEGTNPRAPKWGFTATAPGASLLLRIGASGPAAAAANATATEGAGRPSAVLVILAYLRSYERMGRAAVHCEGDGCICGADAQQQQRAGQGPAAVLDGHWTERSSQLQLSCFPARLPASGCRVRVVVASESSAGPGQHKFKLGGLIVSHTSPGLAGRMCYEHLEAAQRAAGFRER